MKKDYPDRTVYKNDEGQLHRTDGPAIEWNDGSKHWYQNGLLHRTDGPSVIYPDGYEEWFQNGKLHRDDGPAVDFVNEYKEYWLDDKNITDKVKSLMEQGLSDIEALEICLL